VGGPVAQEDRISAAKITLIRNEPDNDNNFVIVSSCLGQLVIIGNNASNSALGIQTAFWDWIFA
jgi:hypothetical protein